MSRTRSRRKPTTARPPYVPRQPNGRAAESPRPQPAPAAPGTEHDPVDEVTSRLFGAAIEGMDVVAAAIGDRLGYYQALDGPALTPPQLASVTRTHARYAREWLEHQAMAGYVEMVRGARGEEHAYRLAPGVAEVLARPGSLTSLAPVARQVAAAVAQWNRVVDGARNGRGVGWAVYGSDMRESQMDLNEPQLRELLGTEWLPVAFPRLHQRLEDGEEIRVADIGCGGGWAAIGLAEDFPGVSVDGYDIDPATVEAARANVASVGLEDRVRIVEGDVAATALRGEYDLVMAFECIHDMPAPVEVLSAMNRMLRPGGQALVADMAGAEEFTPDRDPVQRFLYGFSVLVCLPDAMAGGAVDGTGTVIRPSTMNRYARQAGFSHIDVVPIEHEFWRFYTLRP